jgi:meckelin
VSLIVLDEQYHGYYLHCRSPHAYADGTMAELVEMLHKEEAGEVKCLDFESEVM